MKRPLIPPPVDPETLMTSAEVAALVRTSIAQLHNAVARGQMIAGRRIPGLGHRWRRADLLAWLAAK